MAYAYVKQRLLASDDSLLDQLLSLTQESLNRSRILGLARDPVKAWERLESSEPVVAEHYWEFFYFGLGQDFSRSLELAWSLLDAGRPAAAIDVVSIYERHSDTYEAAEIVAVALEMLLGNELQDPEMQRLRRSTLEAAFVRLARHRTAIGHQRVVTLEWNLFPVLGFDADMPTLHEFIVDEPAFFVELVSHAFRPDSSPVTDPEDPTELERQRSLATRAYEVLRSLRRCPGVRDGALDQAALRRWVDAARSGLAQIDRGRVGDRQIGEVLATHRSSTVALGSPMSSETSSRTLQATTLTVVSASGTPNERGTTWRGVLDGGAMERDLAEEYMNQSDAATPWPRTRRVIKRPA